MPPGVDEVVAPTRRPRVIHIVRDFADTEDEVIAVRDPSDPWPPDSGYDVATHPCTDQANADRLRRERGARMLYAVGIGWHVWGADGWSHDELAARGIAGGLGRIITREASALSNLASCSRDGAEREALQRRAIELMKHARASEMQRSVRAALSAAEPGLAIRAGQLDADPWLLGCANGVVDLRTGALRAHRRGDFISRSTGVTFDATATAPTWNAFLARIFRGHADLLPFLQRVAGWWCTGLTEPAHLVVLYGGGANGKSTFTNAISAALGAYACGAPPGLLMARHGEQHPTELALLHSKRLVLAAESGEGGRLDEERVKAITGGDPITARRMREDFFTFMPTHKTALATNHKPVVRGGDEGIWRRLLLVPFTETIPAEERDPHLGAKLRAELPGILAWAVAGCIAWQRGGLDAPAMVRAATNEYRSEQDVIGLFLEERCVLTGNATVASAELFADYRDWCDEQGERPMTAKALGLRLQERGTRPFKGTGGQRRWQGIGLAVPRIGSAHSGRMFGSSNG